MPNSNIRTISLGLFRRDDAILVFVDHDSVKCDHFCRPLGGGVEFGERAEAALAREIREELGQEIENVRLFAVLENVFTYEGRPSHEIVFVFDADFVDEAIYQKEILAFYEEAMSASFTARWMTLEQIEAENVRLVPEALRELLTREYESTANLAE